MAAKKHEREREREEETTLHQNIALDQLIIMERMSISLHMSIGYSRLYKRQSLVNLPILREVAPIPLF